MALNLKEKRGFICNRRKKESENSLWKSEERRGVKMSEHGGSVGEVGEDDGEGRETFVRLSLPYFYHLITGKLLRLRKFKLNTVLMWKGQPDLKRSHTPQWRRIIHRENAIQREQHEYNRRLQKEKGEKEEEEMGS